MYLSIETPDGRFGCEADLAAVQAIKDIVFSKLVEAAEAGRDVPLVRFRKTRDRVESPHRVTRDEFEERLHDFLDSI